MTQEDMLNPYNHLGTKSGHSHGLRKQSTGNLSKIKGKNHQCPRGEVQGSSRQLEGRGRVVGWGGDLRNEPISPGRKNRAPSKGSLKAYKWRDYLQSCGQL